jgi:signal transduction histidine kinase
MGATAKAYVAVVFAAGVLTTLVTLAQAEWRAEHWFELIAYTLMGALSSRLKVTLPGVRGTQSVNFIFILLGVVELQRVDVLIISFVATLTQCLLAAKVRPKPVQLIFNLGNATTCAILCDMVYHFALIGRLDGSMPVRLLFASLSYFLVNSLVVSEIIALTENKAGAVVWRDNFFWTAPQYIFGAALVGVMHFCNVRFGWQYEVLAFPGIYLLDRSYRVYLRRLQEEKQHVRDHEVAYAQLAEAQERMITLSRQAGMAEVATSVLHNVGNVLNSVNVSATLVADKIRESPVVNLATLAGMLQEHSQDLQEFIANDRKGQRILPYLGKLAAQLQAERQTELGELQLLRQHIDHIKGIVATQQSYGKVSGLIEMVSLAELVEDSIRIVQPGHCKDKIEVERDFEALPGVALDKHSVLQILLNLVRNAEQAIDKAGTPARKIRLRIGRHGGDRVRIEVSDTGVGLSAENLTRIFAHGFTTKEQGHGFGLHSGALSAKQLGGKLWAESDGEGRGATFKLELPLASAPANATGAAHEPAARQEQRGRIADREVVLSSAPSPGA